MPVVDSSVLVELLADGPGAGASRERLHRGEPLWVPHLVDAEVGQALRRGVRLGRVSTDDAEEALWELEEMPLRRVSHELLLHHAWALRDNVTFYDALYVALAELLEEPLVTFDERLGRSGVAAAVEVLPRLVEVEA